MMKRMIAVALLSMALSACDSATTENGNNNGGPKPASTQAPATPAATPEATPGTAAQLKPGDKVKVNSNGTVATATVVSIDEKGGKVTVRIDGEKQDKTVAMADVAKQ